MTVVAIVHITIRLLHNRRGCSAFGLHLALVVYYAVCLTMPFLSLYAGIMFLTFANSTEGRTTLSGARD